MRGRLGAGKSRVRMSSELRNWFLTIGSLAISLKDHGQGKEGKE